MPCSHNISKDKNCKFEIQLQCGACEREACVSGRWGMNGETWMAFRVGNHSRAICVGIFVDFHGIFYTGCKYTGARVCVCVCAGVQQEIKLKWNMQTWKICASPKICYEKIASSQRGTHTHTHTHRCRSTPTLVHSLIHPHCCTGHSAAIYCIINKVNKFWGYCGVITAIFVLALVSPAFQLSVRLCLCVCVSAGWLYLYVLRPSVGAWRAGEW